jgi:hypothetical protein
MERENIPVTSQSHIEIHRETITPETQAQVADILTALLPIAKTEKVTGTISVNLADGGVRTISVERREENQVK